MFELAAFFHSHKEDGRSKLVIKHVALAPYTLIMMTYVAGLMAMDICLPSTAFFLLIRVVYICGVTLLFTHLFERFWHDVSVAEQQFRTFSWQNLKCHCCSVDHVRDGERMPCDRVILENCIVQWFGSVEALEACVRHKVCDTFVAQVSGGFPFGYFWLLGGNYVVWCGQADFVAARAHGGAHRYATSLLITTAAWWLWVSPNMHLLLSRIARWMQRKGHEKSSVSACYAIKCAGYSVNLLNFGLPFVYQRWCHGFLLDPVFASSAFAGTTLLVAALSYRWFANPGAWLDPVVP